MKKINSIDWITFALLIVGGLNWGSVALLNVDFVSTLFGDQTLLTRLVFGLVGLSAVYVAFSLLTTTNHATDRQPHYAKN